MLEQRLASASVVMPPPWRCNVGGRRAAAARRSATSCLPRSCAMISAAVRVDVAGRELVGGEEVVGQIGPEVLAVLERRCSRRSGSAPRSAAASGCPRAPQIAAFIEIGDEARRLADRRGPSGPSSAYCGDVLAEAVLGLARHRDHRDGRRRSTRCTDAGRAALGDDGRRTGRARPWRRRSTFCAVPSSQLPTTSTISQVRRRAFEHLVEADVAVAVDRVAGDAAHLEHLAGFGRRVP